MLGLPGEKEKEAWLERSKHWWDYTVGDKVASRGSARLVTVW
jgi:hypothetical protein